MNIGFDAKRAYHNKQDLATTVVHCPFAVGILPGPSYYLFNPKSSSLFQIKEENIHNVFAHFHANLFPSAWRSSWIKKDLKKYKIDLYHGLSHEIPWAFRKQT